MDRSIVFTFGRANPPTVGHQKLVNKVKDIAAEHKADHLVVLSHSHDSTKNPLTGPQKLLHAHRAFPGTNLKLSSKEKPSLIHHLTDLSNQGYKHAHVVVGADRVNEFNRILKNYNGKKDLFNFKSIKVHSAGDRDPDAQGVEGMSASKMRGAATAGRYKEFASGVPAHVSDAHKKELYRDVRKGMGLKESVAIIDEGVHDPGIFKVVFIGGGPGSGKDFIKGLVLMGHGLREINSDQAFEFLSNKNELSLIHVGMSPAENARRDMIRTRAKLVTSTKQDLSVHGRLGLIINSTADQASKIMKLDSKLKTLGYDSMVIFVHASNEVSQRRNIERGRMGGRTVDEPIRYQKWKDAMDQVDDLRHHFGSDFILVDNSVDYDPSLQQRLLKVYKRVKEFVSKPLVNPIAKQWIEHQFQYRKESLSSGGSDYFFAGAGDHGKDNRDSVNPGIIPQKPNTLKREEPAADREWGTNKLRNKYQKDTPGEPGRSPKTGYQKLKTKLGKYKYNNEEDFEMGSGSDGKEAPQSLGIQNRNNKDLNHE